MGRAFVNASGPFAFGLMPVGADFILNANPQFFL